jgi:hypothetical protein
MRTIVVGPPPLLNHHFCTSFTLRIVGLTSSFVTICTFLEMDSWRFFRVSIIIGVVRTPHKNFYPFITTSSIICFSFVVEGFLTGETLELIAAREV